MKISIIGSGDVGSSLAQKLIKAGHTVLIGAKFPLSEKSVKLIGSLSSCRITHTKAR